MKTNNFRVREKKEKRIIIEEERTKNPLILFFRRHKNFWLLLLLTLVVCTLLTSVGIAFSLFRGSNDYDISYISGSSEIESNNDPEIDDDDVKEELLGEVARSDGVVLLVETFMSGQGDVISYYTDGTAVVVQSNGDIYRISPLANGNYGIDRNGKIASDAKTVMVTSHISTLSDGTAITYYSDGTAKVELKGETIFVRDSNNIKLNNGNSFSYVDPSGVALTNEKNRVGDSTVIKFTDGTTLIISGNTKTLVNKNTPPTIGGTVTYDKNNSFSVIGEKTLDDGNVVTHFSNGSLIITDKKGNVTYLRKAGDLVTKSNKVYEIMPNSYGFSRSTVSCSDGKQVTYFDNGAAVIIYPDGNRLYVEDSSDIIYDGNKNIVSIPDSALKIGERNTTAGDRVINFNNGKSQVIKPNGSSYIIDTDKLTFASNGNVVDKSKEVKKNTEEDSEHDPGKGIYISEAENTYNKVKNIEDTVFTIKNDNNKTKTLRITIEEIDDYRKFATKRLAPNYVKFQATVGNDYISARYLTNNVWKNDDGVINYVIYDGNVGPKTTVSVALTLYVDYAELTNEHQDSGFVGTINVYVNDV